jgi:tetrahydromethanopterin S-methyltransferase subunit A
VSGQDDTKKVSPHKNYPVEEGMYIRGNDLSSVAVTIILNAPAYNIPPELEKLVQAGIEGGAALSGMLQTENIGIEKVVCNIVANPNIRYLVVGGPESEGHLTGEAIKALLQHGIDDKRRIIGTNAPVPLLLNLPMEYIDRFRKQLTLVDLQFQDIETVKTTVRSCVQDRPVELRDQSLFDPGAYPEPPLSGMITWSVTQPWTEPANEKEVEAKKKVEALKELLKNRRKNWP